MDAYQTALVAITLGAAIVNGALGYGFSSITVPLALLFAWMVSSFYRPAFEASLIVGYLLTNLLGLMLMHKGAQKLFGRKQKRYSRESLWKDLLISLAYTAGLLVLLRLKVIAPLSEYVSGGGS